MLGTTGAMLDLRPAVARTVGSTVSPGLQLYGRADNTINHETKLTVSVLQ